MPHAPQIKICGLSNAADALACAQLGADAVGFVFFPKSPRNVTPDQARRISLALPDTLTRVGVFVNDAYDTVMRTITHCRLQAAQLHGQEPPGLVRRLEDQGVVVIKALFLSEDPDLSRAREYSASGFLVEQGKGKLPGGNAEAWQWEQARTIRGGAPLILAGGLDPDNVLEAVATALPDAVDVSSGVESAPGQKDMAKVSEFIRKVSKSRVGKPLRKIF